MHTKKSYTVMSEEDFAQVKMLQKLKFNTSQITDITKRSIATQKRIEKADTFEDYRRITAERNVRYHAKAKAKKIVEAPVEEKAEEQPDVSDLGRIANALERLADAWEASPKKKGFF